MMEELFGYIERITFQNAMNGYTVARLKSSRYPSLICIVGVMPSVNPGETVRCQGEWKTHLVHGKQFEVSSHKIEAPSDLAGITKYLSSGLIKGIGKTYAKRIVEKFKESTLDIIDKEPERLLDVQGIGKKKLETIKGHWSDQRTIRDVMIFLQSVNISPTYAQKIFKFYGDKSIEKVKENPFNLARDIHGIGFKTADTIAEKMGIPKEAPERLEAGLEFLLSQLSNDGHVCYPVGDLVKLGVESFEVPQPLIDNSIDNLVKGDRLKTADMLVAGEMTPFAWIKPLYLCEVGIGKELQRLKETRSPLREIQAERAIEWVEKELKIELARNQKDAIAQALKEKVQIITGGPGTGKSTITNAIITILSKLTTKITLAAPTGRAAKRMSEITKRKASTIHSLLEFDFKVGGFKKGRDNPLDCDLIIIDEASMIDTSLMYSLLKAVPHYSKIIFVGDIDQLPSVGPGNVLKDMIASKQIPITMLREIFRQARGSKIITNSHLINQGKYPNTHNEPDSDFFFIDKEEKEDVLRSIIALVTERLPNKYRYHPLKDIQVLAPMKRGVIGTENLNMMIQEVMIKDLKNPLFRNGKRFFVGDKVMQIRNNYDKEVYNGDVGFIKSISLVDQEVVVEMEDQDVFYDFSDLDELVLAYAVSIHKYQGSECPCIVMPIHTAHFKMLHRNLLYTGVTRGKQLVVVVGNKKALSIAVHNDEVKKRYTGLVESICGASQRVLM